MSSYFFKMLFTMLVCLSHAKVSILGFISQSHVSNMKCIESERQALLNFKHGIVDDHGMLSTWSDDENNSDCCKWKGIHCNNQTGHVLMLHIRGNDTQYLEGAINFTSFIHLPNIQHLDLSSNAFGDSHIPQLIGSFTNLRYLNLSWSGFVGRIPYDLGNLSKLRYLDLKRNSLEGTIPSQLGKLTSLQYLDLSKNFGSYGESPYQPKSLNGTIPSQLGELPSLRYLDLSENDLDEEIPYQLGNLSQLRYLNLGENSFNGTIPSQLGKLTSLRYLRLGGRYDVLKINNAKWLSSLTSLTTLDLCSLHTAGSSRHWPQFISEIIPNLRELRLADCGLSDDDISLLFPSHSNLSTSLSVLDLSLNMLTSSTFHLLSNYTFNLKQLYLDENNIVLSSPHFPNFPSLVILDLSYNNLTSLRFQGSFKIGSKIRELHLENCSLTDRSFLAPSTSIQNSSSSLATLDLTENLLKSSAIFNWISNFTTNLHSLSLYFNLLECFIPDGFGKAMNSLESLHVSGNNLQGEIPTSLGNICTLQELFLSGNNLQGEIPTSLGNISTLQELFLFRNNLQGEIPTSLGNISTLQELDLSNNNLQGEIPTSLGNICTLQDLDLSNNNLSGEMFSFIQNSSCSNRMAGMLPNLSIFTFLRRLVLSNNQLTGEIPRGIGLLYEFEYLYLQGNHLEGHVNELHLTNLSKLEALDLSDNSLLSLKFHPTWVPPFQLSDLGLASCKLGPSFPSWLQSQSDLNFLDISDAGIDDFVPEWFWNKLHTIYQVNMSYNSLKGTIPNLPLNLTYGDFHIIILNSNQFEGGIPAFFSQVATLDLSKNKISDLNAFLCRKRATIHLLTLDLSNNQIMGQLPDCWEHLTSLEFLDLRNNNLSGKIPQSMGSLVNLEALVLRNNRLTGDLPFQLKNCTYLQILDVSENLLSGPIPSWIGESLQQLKILSLRVNGFFGSIPVYLCYLSQIQVFDLSRNNLAGRIPTCLRNFRAMMERSANAGEIVRKRKMSMEESYEDIYESNLLMMWKGQEQVFLNPDIFLKSIDLSSNDLRGEIPKEIGCLLGLVSLNLARNSLNGEIPPEIGNLNQLDFLDLSRNHLSGRIPSTLSKIDGLGYLNLSNNDLSGRIPWEGHLQDFDASSFEGNIGLCGQQLNKSCPGDDTGAQPQARAVHGEDDNSIFFGALYMSLGLGFFIGFWGLLGPILLWKPWRNAYGRFLNKLIDNVFVKVQVKKAKFREWLRG